MLISTKISALLTYTRMQLKKWHINTFLLSKLDLSKVSVMAQIRDMLSICSLENSQDFQSDLVMVIKTDFNSSWNRCKKSTKLKILLVLPCKKTSLVLNITQSQVYSYFIIVLAYLNKTIFTLKCLNYIYKLHFVFVFFLTTKKLVIYFFFTKNYIFLLKIYIFIYYRLLEKIFNCYWKICCWIPKSVDCGLRNWYFPSNEK